MMTEVRENISYDEAKEKDYKEMAELCTPEGWSAQPEDIRELCSTLPAGAQVAHSGGRVIGFCLIDPLTEDEAFMCLMVVHKDFRRYGLGTELVNRSVAAMGDRNVSLYASAAGVPFYRKYGFKSEQNPTYLYQTRFKPQRDGLKDTPTLKNVRIVPLSEVNFNDLLAYDTSIHRIRREKWIRFILETEPDSVVALDESNKIVGYAGVHLWHDRNYTQLKPLLADSPEVAALILKHVMTIIPADHSLKVKIPTENPEAMSLMEKIGFSTETKAPDMIMFRKYKFQIEMNKVYSVMNGFNQFA